MHLPEHIFEMSPYWDTTPMRERRNTLTILTDKPEGGSPFARPGPEWEVSVKEMLMDS